jgi:hypothetical protein
MSSSLAIGAHDMATVEALPGYSILFEMQP